MTIEPYLSPGVAGATLTVDLTALCANYSQLSSLCGPAECAAAVKGDAYGTGVDQVARALSTSGCRTFFVAQLSEAAELRGVLPDATVYVLNGLVPEWAGVYRELDLRPVLGNLDEIAEWSAFCGECGERLAAAVHVDSGINRLGLATHDVDALAQTPEIGEGFEWALVMSHLACADQPDNVMNRKQTAAFDALRARLPQAPASLANSGGTLNGAAFHYDLVRPGIALYGGNPHAGTENPMRGVVSLVSEVLQVRDVPTGETVGYGATWRAERPSRIAIVPVGYFDGYFRATFRTSTNDPAGVFIGHAFAPLAGRVSMDMITVDVTDIASEKMHRGAKVELIGPNISVDDVARWAGTIPYEVLTALGSRFARVYTNPPLEQ
jgi:alanine racemase